MHVEAKVWGVEVELETLRRPVVFVDTVAGNDEFVEGILCCKGAAGTC